MELISVIVPVYNVADYLRECLDSLVNQTYENLEIILIDDGSDDGSGSVCEEYAVRDTRIKVIHKENEGQSIARNVGLEMASGDYVGFIDSDDYIAEMMYEQLWKIIKRHNADLAMCGVCKFDQKSSKPMYEKYAGETSDGKTALMDTLCSKSVPLAVWNKLYKKEVFTDIRFCRETFGEDFRIVPALYKNVRKVAYTNELLYFYRVRENSSMACSRKKANPCIIAYAYEVYQETVRYFPDCVGKVNQAILMQVVRPYNKIVRNAAEKENQEFCSQARDFFVKMLQERGVLNRKDRLRLRLAVYLPFVYKLLIRIKK